MDANARHLSDSSEKKIEFGETKSSSRALGRRKICITGEPRVKQHRVAGRRRTSRFANFARRSQLLRELPRYTLVARWIELTSRLVCASEPPGCTTPATSAYRPWTRNSECTHLLAARPWASPACRTLLNVNAITSERDGTPLFLANWINELQYVEYSWKTPWLMFPANGQHP